MRRRAGKADEKRAGELFRLMDEQGVLDVAEQEELVAILGQQTSRQAARWSSAFGGLAAFTCLVYTYAAAHQIAYPWSTRYTAEFQMLLSSWMVVTGLLANALSCGCSALDMLMGRSTEPTGRRSAGRQRLQLAAAVTGATCAAFWMGSLLAEHTRVRGQAALPSQVGFPWELLWLPMGPAVLALLGRHLHNMARSLDASVGSLRQTQYNYKRL